MTVRFRWPDRTPVKDRTVVKVRTEAAARRWGEQRETELRTKGPPTPVEAARKARGADEKHDPTLDAFSDEWLDKHARANLQKASGIEAKQVILRLHILPHVGKKRLSAITDEVVADLRAKWVTGGYSDDKGRPIRPTSAKKTINNRLTVLNALLKTAYEWQRIDHLPCRIRLLKVDNGREAAHYDHETYERLVAAARALDPRYFALILLAGDAGLRRGELIALHLEDIDFVAGKMTVRRSSFISRKVETLSSPKSGKEKPVPLTPRLLSALRAIRHLRGPRVFYSDAGKTLTNKVLRRWVERVEKAAGLPVSGKVHICRHTFASHLAMAGVPNKTIQSLARHESMTTTLRYMHLSPGATDEGIKMLVRSRASGGRPVHGSSGGEVDDAAASGD